MLRVVSHKSASAARKYYSEGLHREDYYSEKQEVVGKWHGKAARLLGLVGDVTLHSASVNVPAYTILGTYSNRAVIANCDPGEKGLGGGADWVGDGDATQLITVLSAPIYDATAKKITGWRARGGNDTNTSHQFTVYVLCTK